MTGSAAMANGGMRMSDLISRAAAVRALVSSNGDYLDAWERLERIPAIDAIPVEWLFDWRDCALKEGMNPELVEWIEYILQIWSREKGAR